MVSKELSDEARAVLATATKTADELGLDDTTAACLGTAPYLAELRSSLPQLRPAVLAAMSAGPI